MRYRGFARPAEVQHDIVLVGPQIEILEDDLGPLVDLDASWPVILGSNPLEGFDHVAATVTGPGLERYTLSNGTGASIEGL